MVLVRTYYFRVQDLYALNLSDIASKILTIKIMCVIFHIKRVGMFMVYLNEEFYMSLFSSSLAIAIKPMDKYIFHAAAIL
jgi:hypothetical protein